MRRASRAVGLIGCAGGLFGLAITVVGDAQNILANPGVRAMVLLSLAVVVLMIVVGAVGAFLVSSKPSLGGTLMLLSGVVGLVMPGYAYAAPVVILAAVLAFISLKFPGKPARKAGA